MRKSDPCFCGKPATFGECCGRRTKNDEDMFYVRRAGAEEAHHFFLWNLGQDSVYFEEGEALVFKDRSKAIGFLERLEAAGESGYVVAGMGSERWAKFQQIFPKYRIVLV